MPHIALPDDERLYYEAHGQGDALLLVSGLFGRASFWPERVIARLSGRYRVITHDHRGIGRSTRSNGPYSVAQMSDDVLRLCDALRLDRVHFLGHSLGGAIGQDFAIRFPARLNRLVLTATWPGPDGYFVNLLKLRRDMLARADWDLYDRFATLFMKPSWWVRDHAFELFANESAPPDEALRRIMIERIEAVITFDRRADLSWIEAPTLVIGAQDDSWTPAYFTAELGQRIARARTVVLPDGQHFFPQVHIDRFADIVLDFLQAAPVPV